MSFTLILVVASSACVEQINVEFMYSMAFYKAKNSELAFKDRIYLFIPVFANFIEICQEMKKFNLFEVAIISVIEAAIFVSL